MMALGQFFAQHLQLPAVFELIGDVGTGKTTFTRGLAQGLGISEPVTSPSFTLSKRYTFSPDIAGQISCSTDIDQPSSIHSSDSELIHYDFYRLDDPGIMRDELAEALSQPNSVVVVEWGGDVADLLPEYKYQLQFQLTESGSREISANAAAQVILDQYTTFNSGVSA